ncbi:lysoplasmalogenase [Kribbella jejuensis]|uniref:Putative membrane protein YhhN n=1 Tax=Kribbella jejuensis TaxID=236068 RepID=A0A542ER76_9ACTN|nr:lysoplasmalogenase [Kribbella jejuensis]TQJ17853.1 putative membrane protein YhhN [Kribbella jejuensis]
MNKGRAWLLAYGVLTVVHLVTIAIGETWSQLITKVLLMPVLAVWVRLNRGPTTLLVALVASLAGDFLLQVDQLLPGMAAFGVAHVCYLMLFVHRARRRSLLVVAVYAVVWLGALVLLWSGLGDIRFPVALYSLLVTATAVTSAWNGWRPGLGGALFLISDGLIGAGLAGHGFAGRDYLVMATYCIAQYLLASSLLRGDRR